MTRAPAAGLATPLLALPGLARAQRAPAVIAGGQPPSHWDSVAGVMTEATPLRIADRSPPCIHLAPVARDADVTLRFRPVDGCMDPAGGIAVWVQDANTSYVSRVTAAKDYIRLYPVSGGRRIELAGRDRLPIAAGTWHTLRLRPEGDRFMAWPDEELLFRARNSRIAGAGRAALRSIADSQTICEPPRIEVLR
ncbi:hypothetical protein [Dankookia rubra]|uniref:hypothetical protein n=1 Tax=Dankookia rubra TaxID=1442381 RepID=UPI001F4F6947|nr:hypothetical protein [Dankookia rubra]